jgi:hypothetical protein
MNLVRACDEFPILGRDFCEKRDRYMKWVTNEHRNIVRRKASYRVVLTYLEVEAAWHRLRLAAAIERASRYAEIYEVDGIEWHQLPSLGVGGEQVQAVDLLTPSVDWLTPSPFVGGEHEGS